MCESFVARIIWEPLNFQIEYPTVFDYKYIKASHWMLLLVFFICHSAAGSSKYVSHGMNEERQSVHFQIKIQF